MSEAKLSKRVSLERMRALGVAPATIFDVGFATGTTGLYGVFEGARYVIVEPLAESEPFIEAARRDYPGTEWVHAAAGRAPGKATFVVSPTLSGSSFNLKPEVGQPREVEVATIDGVVAARSLPGPFLLKLDVQGYELEALAGAEATLRDTLAVIVEASLWGDLKKKMPSFAEVVAWFDQRGFVLYDLAQIVRRKHDDAIVEMDLVFCPADSPLRAVKRYKTTAGWDEAVAQRRGKFGL